MTPPVHPRDVEVSTAEVRAKLDAGEVELVDVREPYEWEAGHIAGSRHIEMQRLAGSADELPRDRPVVFYCRVGARSAMAAMAFRRAGIDAWSMTGGLEAWHAEGHPLTPEGGHVAPH